MKNLLYPLIVPALALTTAVPKSIYFFDNFDNPPDANPILPIFSFVQGTAGGALYYDAFSYADHSTTALTLAVPSGKYCIGSGVTAQLLQGQRGWRPMNSTIKSFDETSIAYSYQLYDGTGNPTVAITCTIQVTGVKFGTGNTVVQELVYNPGVLPFLDTFNTTRFGDNFKGLTRVDVQLADAPAPGTVIVVNFDDHAYKANY